MTKDEHEEIVSEMKAEFEAKLLETEEANSAVKEEFESKIFLLETEKTSLEAKLLEAEKEPSKSVIPSYSGLKIAVNYGPKESIPYGTPKEEVLKLVKLSDDYFVPMEKKA